MDNRLAISSIVMLALGAAIGVVISNHSAQLLDVAPGRADFLGFLSFATGALLGLIVAVIARRRAAGNPRASGRWIASLAIALNATACGMSALIYAVNPAWH